MSKEEKTGWVALAGQWVTLNDGVATVYNWDELYWSNRAAAIAAGAELIGSDDFNLARVENGTVVWWGWMTEAHPITDAEEAADQFGWSVLKDGAV